MSTNNEQKKNLSIFRFTYIGLILVVLLSVAMVLFFRYILDISGVNRAEYTTTYSTHFALLVDGTNTDFWNDVYREMQAEAAPRDIYVELKDLSGHNDYTLCDLMDICIAGSVDGIIVQNNNEEGLNDKINEAVSAGIPVVTILDDAPASLRVSYIGINPYGLGQSYSQKILELVKNTDENILIEVLLTDPDLDGNEYQIFTQINTDLMTDAQTSGRVTVEAVRIPQGEAFASDQSVRNLLHVFGDTPDILVCFSTLQTEAAYQSLIDYNMVGQVQIIGYYQSATILEAIREGNIATTMKLDTHQMGENAIQALCDYIQEGRTNSYYGTDLTFVRGEDLADEEE
ncbi:MAG: substrate-binding domain-containing protein [Lachnospiraceae bacterium]|nr:substrate-binding domain-containing protein [Lachnospiraceae bacterium]